MQFQIPNGNFPYLVASRVRHSLISRARWHSGGKTYVHTTQNRSTFHDFSSDYVWYEVFRRKKFSPSPINQAWLILPSPISNSHRALFQIVTTPYFEFSPSPILNSHQALFQILTEPYFDHQTQLRFLTEPYFDHQTQVRFLTEPY